MHRLLVFLCLLAVPATAATLRPLTTLNAPVVRLSDLFEDAGEQAARVLGPGPVPGGRIVVEAAQLAAIARQFGVAWKPASPGDRTILERPGRPLAREVVMEVLTTALASAGVAPDSEIEAPTLSLPLIPFDSQLRPVVTQLNHDSTTGEFAATLAVGGAEMATVQVRLVGKVHETTAVMVPLRRVQVGEVVRREDLRGHRLRAASLRADVARMAEDVVGLTPRNALIVGQPIRLTDLVRPPAIRKGEMVQMVLSGGGLSLIGQAVAQEAGAPGERVRVMNPSSRAILEGTVIGPGQIRVSPDSLPTQPPLATAMQVVPR